MKVLGSYETNLLVLWFTIGGATLQLSWNSKTNPWALTSFLKENAQYFGSIEAEGIFGYVCVGFSTKYLFIS